MSPEQPIIQADNLSRSFPSGDTVIHALREISLTVNEVADVVLVAPPFEPADVGEKRVIRLRVGT